MSKAPPSGVTLSREDAAVVKGMLERGDRQHDIAAWFGVNGGRIADIRTGKKFDDVDPIFEGLPPPGPYLAGKSIYEVKNEISRIISSLSSLSHELDEKMRQS
jgi:hypothetical protein